MGRGQAAMEFLMTYGWAIAAVIVSIGALSYFGIINPKSTIPESCVMASGLSCKETIVTSGTQTGLNMRLHNDMSDPITINAVQADPGDGPKRCDFTPALVTSGSDLSVNCSFTNIFTVGDTVKLKTSVNYTKSGGYFNHVLNGEITAKVQPTSAAPT